MRFALMVRASYVRSPFRRNWTLVQSSIHSLHLLFDLTQHGAKTLLQVVGQDFTGEPPLQNFPPAAQLNHLLERPIWNDLCVPGRHSSCLMALPRSGRYKEGGLFPPDRALLHAGPNNDPNS